MQWNGAHCCEFDGKSMETVTTTWSEFPNGGKPIVEQILAHHTKEIQKSRIVRVPIKDPGMKVNLVSKVISDKKFYNRVHDVYQFHQNRLASPYDGS